MKFKKKKKKMCENIYQKKDYKDEGVKLKKFKDGREKYFIN